MVVLVYSFISKNKQRIYLNKIYLKTAKQADGLSNNLVNVISDC